eukprot:364661-Chlamydomonas_euryale.AAC.1
MAAAPLPPPPSVPAGPHAVMHARIEARAAALRRGLERMDPLLARLMWPPTEDDVTRVLAFVSAPQAAAAAAAAAEAAAAEAATEGSAGAAAASSSPAACAEVAASAGVGEGDEAAGGRAARRARTARTGTAVATAPTAAEATMSDSEATEDASTDAADEPECPCTFSVHGVCLLLAALFEGMPWHDTDVRARVLDDLAVLKQDMRGGAVRTLHGPTTSIGELFGAIK